ncbi:MAG: hypothetical protein AMXMBFR7_42770 [Planctomycetota bacterium]
MSFPRYPRYKESGVEWLGQVPEHWAVISIKWLSPVKRGASPRPIDDPAYFDDEGEFAWVRIADVSACNGVLNETTQRLSELGSSLSVKIAPGDLFVSIAGTVGKPCISAIKACIHDGFVYFPALKIPALFLYRIFEGGVCYGGLGKWGTQLNLNTDTIGSIRVAIPPADEMESLLSFLGRETAKIDALVSEQRRLIELLKEKRQAVISHAVTKGLNPAAPMKPSGIEWLADVPAHWEVKPIKHIAQVGNGSTPNREVPEYWTESGFPWLNSSVVNSPLVTEAEGFVTERALSECHLPVVIPPAVLLGITGQGRTRGMASMLGIKATINQHVAYVKPRIPDLDVNFLFRTFQAAYLVLRRDSEEAGATKGAITCEQIGNLRIPAPPLPEQQAIVALLDAETAKLDALTAEAQRAIDLLQERRTALISAAVTGQIDVRAHSPAEVA